MSSTVQPDRTVVEAPKRGLARLNIEVENVASGVVLVNRNRIAVEVKQMLPRLPGSR